MADISKIERKGVVYNIKDAVVPMIDSTIKNMCSYSDLLMRNSKNGYTY